MKYHEHFQSQFKKDVTMENSIPEDLIVIDHPRAAYSPSQWFQVQFRDIFVMTNKSPIEYFPGDATLLKFK